MTEAPAKIVAFETGRWERALTPHHGDMPHAEYVRKDIHDEAITALKEAAQLMRECSWSPTVSGTRQKATMDRLRAIMAKVEVAE